MTARKSFHAAAIAVLLAGCTCDASPLASVIKSVFKNSKVLVTDQCNPTLEGNICARPPEPTAPWYAGAEYTNDRSDTATFSETGEWLTLDIGNIPYVYYYNNTAVADVNVNGTTYRTATSKIPHVHTGTVDAPFSTFRVATHSSIVLEGLLDLYVPTAEADSDSYAWASTVYDPSAVIDPYFTLHAFTLRGLNATEDDDEYHYYT